MLIGEQEILKFLEGSMDQNEQQAMLSWISISDSNRKEFESFKRIYDESNKLQKHVSLDLDLEWESFQKLVPALRTQEVIKPVRTIPLFRIGIAASLLLLLGFFVVNNQNQIISIDSGSSQQLVSLPDGSSINLYPSSRLSYLKKFDEKTRRYVELNGVASFDINSDPSRPFLIKANQTVTEVLSTEFKINTTTTETEIEVFSGVVSFYLESNPNDQITLEEGDKASFVGGQLAKYVEPKPEPELPVEEPVIEKKVIAKETPKKIEPKKTISKPKVVTNPYGKQSQYLLQNVIDFLNKQFGKKFKKQKKCKINKEDTVNINLSGDMEFILDQLRLQYNIETEKGKCDDCIELKSISKK